jgi:predicted HicB family RNase H-like nuclease
VTNPDTSKCENLGVSPNKPKTPTVSFRVDPELWRAAVDRAAERGESASDVIRRALLAYVEEDDK